MKYWQFVYAVVHIVSCSVVSYSNSLVVASERNQSLFCCTIWV